jgi:hypothetical protein
MSEDTGTEETKDEETEEEESDQESSGGGDSSSGGDADSFSKEAREKVAELEDDPPSDLSEWPDDEAKYVTLGGSEGDKGWNDGPTKNLGPADLEYQEDGSVTIEGEEVDNPEDYKGEPIPLASEIEDQKAAKGEKGDEDGGDDDSSGSNPERPETGDGPGEDSSEDSGSDEAA